MLKDNGDKIDADATSDLEEKIAAVRTASGGEDVEAIKDAVEALSSASQAVGAKLYEQAGDEAEGGAAAVEDVDDDEVVDAEIIEDEDDSE